VDNGYTTAPPGLKCLKGNEITLEARDDGYTAASVGLKCFKEKQKKKKEKKKYIYLFYFSIFFSCSMGPTHSRRGRWLCCSFAGIEMFQGFFLIF
jgi:hypothetical protein